MINKYVAQTLERIRAINGKIAFIESQMCAVDGEVDAEKKAALYRELANIKRTLEINQQMLNLVSQGDESKVH